jgi:hypothetical protein
MTVADAGATQTKAQTSAAKTIGRRASRGPSGCFESIMMNTPSDVRSSTRSAPRTAGLVVLTADAQLRLPCHADLIRGSMRPFGIVTGEPWPVWQANAGQQLVEALQLRRAAQLV